ncbi:hypothetical protein HPB47_009394 [Ixodes persulcatus]|uniref:Uncharacterized protein n=1 Tax=Ixodes persulcatus TaxID=34615 RepID=A0AC60P246_IXOPE|nr:hypothetical protein HPB47_009394 [Ixodes persulcatus]
MVTARKADVPKNAAGQRYQICKENKVTSSEMLKMLHQYAAGFQRHGVKPGDKVLVHVDDSLESFIAMYGVVFAGGVVIPSELASEEDELVMKIKNGKASHVLTTPSEADLLKKLSEDTHIRTGEARAVAAEPAAAAAPARQLCAV